MYLAVASPRDILHRTSRGRCTVSGSVTSRTRREWLQVMAAMGAGALVEGLIPRELALAATRRAIQQQQDRVAQFRAQIGAIPIQAQPLAEHLTLLELDFPPSPATALPQRVFKEGYKLEANGERLTVTHVPPAHTDTDVAVRFEKANVLHTGDVFFNGFYPYIDGSTGGRIDGMIEAAGRLLSLADSDTKIVPGQR